MKQEEMASMGGKARAKKLSEKRRLEIAMMGVLARKKKTKKKELIYASTIVNGKEVFMHNVIMESILGRPLKKNESVRHKNGNGLDNRRVNLELVTKK